MNQDQLKQTGIKLLKKWWCSLLMLPFIFYSTHQIYWALRYNIFFAVTYKYPFPLNIVHFLVDNFLLIVHEAGHTFFRIFGVRFITILGGSLFQILLPAIILIFFWFNRKSIGMQLSLCLIGYSWLDVAAYAADGGARQLPLIGGLDKNAHDWYNLLVSMHALKYDMTVGIVFTATGILCYLAALLIPAIYQRYEEISPDLHLD
ncbi:MAG TPA: hypothetical protein VJ964_16870 [Balneolaceae bacterium]|nr:hypothetical protein [Balneolaceae bacterium]